MTPFLIRCVVETVWLDSVIFNHQLPACFMLFTSVNIPSLLQPLLLLAVMSSSPPTPLQPFFTWLLALPWPIPPFMSVICVFPWSSDLFCVENWTVKYRPAFADVVGSNIPLFRGLEERHCLCSKPPLLNSQLLLKTVQMSHLFKQKVARLF